MSPARPAVRKKALVVYAASFIAVAQLRQQFPSTLGAASSLRPLRQGDLATLQRLVDSMRHTGPPNERAFAARAAGNLALLHGRLRERNTLVDAVPLSLPSIGQPGPIDEVIIELSLTGPSPRLAARLDSAIAKTISTAVPITDRPYFQAATALARVGSADKARAMLARYRAEVTDTALRRQQQAELHETLGEVALAEHKPPEALAEFRKGDVGVRRRAGERMRPCLAFNLARAFDAAASRTRRRRCSSDTSARRTG